MTIAYQRHSSTTGSVHPERTADCSRIESLSPLFHSARNLKHLEEHVRATVLALFLSFVARPSTRHVIRFYQRRLKRIDPLVFTRLPSMKRLKHEAWSQYPTDSERPTSVPAANTRRHVGPDTDREGVLHRSELEIYHMEHLVSGGWLFDHSTHARYSYYPSDIFPLGSNEEYGFFMRAWVRNVNYPYVCRLYNREGRFEELLKAVVPPHVCPCEFLMSFNIAGREVWKPCSHGGDYGPLTRLAVENELLFRSTFFNKKRSDVLYTHTNRWVYSTFVRPHRGDCCRSNPRVDQSFLTTSGNTIIVTKDWFRYKQLDTTVNRRRRYNDNADTVDEPVGDVTKADVDRHGPEHSETDVRQTRMRRILSELFFGQRFAEEHDSADFHDSLVRCEDYRSYLYSPLLKLDACKHENEDVSYEQRRSGDEIATEIRKCRHCGRVRMA
ncbi:hypothetical protein J6590_096379 [Homalodisca vitripennis]|nr:hypothetical protein J6590_096379 [Homalodisca vitripennis]